MIRLAIAFACVMLITWCFIEGAEAEFVSQIEAEHYRCGNHTTEHCLHIEIEYQQIKGI